MSLKIGDLAPDFTLKSKNMTGEVIDYTLSSYRGKNVLLLFHPLAFTGNCTTEMCSVSAGLNDYNNLNAEVLAVSVDTVFVHEAWAKANGIKIPLLSDFNKEVCAKYGTLYDEFVFGMKGVSKRSAFVIDKDGIIKYAEIIEDAGGKLPDFDKIKDALKG